MDTLKTLYNVGLNLDTSSTMPGYAVVEKQKEYEIRTYHRNKYIVLRLKSVVDENGKVKVNDSITKNVWRIMKYTQGENEKKVTMKFHLPVVVRVDEEANTDSGVSENYDKTEIKIMVTLPIEYQAYNEAGSVQEVPKPLDEELLIEEVDEFRGFVRTFGGFANDGDFKKETAKLAELLDANKTQQYSYKKKLVLCLSYDTPTKLFGRRNEVILVSL